MNHPDDLKTHASRPPSGKMAAGKQALRTTARVFERTEEVFEDADAACDWLTSPNAALDGATPISLLDTEFGAEAVMDTLGRIAHGVFS